MSRSLALFTSCTFGVQNATKDKGLMVNDNGTGTVLHNSMAIRLEYVAPVPWLSGQTLNDLSYAINNSVAVNGTSSDSHSGIVNVTINGVAASTVDAHAQWNVSTRSKSCLESYFDDGW